MATRKVFMLGQSGAGKSSIGNKLLGNEKAFRAAEIGSKESETAEVSQSRSCLEDGLELTVFDTQGMGDTKGRSIKFLDQILTAIKKERPHGLVFVINGGCGSKFGPDVKLALHCFAQCLKPSVDSGLGLPPGRVLLVVNHLPSDATFGGSFSSKKASPEEKQETLARTVNESNDMLSEYLKVGQKIPVEHTFGIQDSDSNLDTRLTAILSAIKSLPDEPLDVGQFRTFAAAMREAIELKDNAVSAEEFAARKADQLKYDIGWHQNRIRDCTIANAATCWIPFANIATTVGFVSAIADSHSKIPGLQEELENVIKNKDGNLANAKEQAEKWLTEMTKMKSAMETK